MEYIVLDLEWNQPFPYSGSSGLISALPAEIIEIGAVKIQGGQTADSFCSYIKPQHYKKLHPWVKRLTGISAGDIDTAAPFPQTLEAFRHWCGGAELFLTWGFDDIPVLCQNMAYYHLDTAWLPHWYNLQMIFNMQTGQPPGQKSLAYALEYLGIAPPAQMHDALTDADCTARIAKKLNVQKGVAHYAQCIKANKTGPAEELPLPEMAGATQQAHFGSRTQALRDKNLSRLCCPACRRVLEENVRWVRQNTAKYIALARCPRHGAYLFRLKLTRAASGGWRVGRVVWRADEKMQQFYKLKLLEAGPAGKSQPVHASGVQE